MKHSTKRLISLTVAVVMFAGALFVFLELVRPAYADLEYLRGVMLGKKSIVESQEKIVAQVRQAMERFSERPELQGAVSLALPLKANEGRVFHEVQKLAEMNEVSLQTFQVNVSTASSQKKPKSSTVAFAVAPVQALNFQARFVGSYENFKKFLEMLETNVRITDVRSVSAEPIARSSPNFYTFNLSAATYYQSD